MIHSEILKILACPSCHNKLELKQTELLQLLYCKKCDDSFKIEDGIIRFVSDDLSQKNNE